MPLDQRDDAQKRIDREMRQFFRKYRCVKRQHQFDALEYRELEALKWCPTCLVTDGFIHSHYEVKLIRN